VSGTRRTPINRRHRPPVTPAAVELFAAMQCCVCTCGPDFDFVHDQRCSGCQRYRELERHLRRELKCKPWERTVEDPAEPPGTANHENWRPDQGARARWLALREAAATRDPR